MSERSHPSSDIRCLLRSFFNYRLPAGVGWAHVAGALLAILFVTQLVTGILLALYYSPSTKDAWDSVRFIQEEVPAGRIVRGIHYFASSAFVVVLGLHICRAFVWGAYKGTRRWTWVTGCCLLVCLLGFGFTGYLLPWDLKAYFGTRVGIEIAGAAPVVGAHLRELLQAGASIGPLTLPRFYALHVIVLPLATLMILALHLTLVRLHGITPLARHTDLEAIRPSHRTFYPDQLAKDLAAGLLLVLILLGLAAWLGAPLESPADPLNTAYVPRPEWYFLGLQQLLRIFQGRLEIVGTVLLPAAGMSLLFILPWIDRNPELRPTRRPLAMLTGTAFAVSMVGLTLWGHMEVKREERAMLDRVGARKADQTERHQVSTSQDKSAVDRGRFLFEHLDCGRCHEKAEAGTGVNAPPSLAFEGNRANPSWVIRYLKEPWRIRFESDGVRPIARMPDFNLEDAEAEDLAAYLNSRIDPDLIPESGIEGPATDERTLDDGRLQFEAYQCLGCHRLEGDGAEIGPHLDGVGARLKPDYIYALLRDPQRIVPGTAMKDAGLWEEEAEAITQYLLTLKTSGH